MASGPAVEDFQHLLRDLYGHVRLGLSGRCSQVRRHDDPVALEQDAVPGGLHSKDVYSGARDMSAVDGFVERLLLDHSAPRGVDQHGPLLHLRKLLAS